MTTAVHFDVLDYVEQAKKLGASEELAKFNARTFETIREEAKQDAKELFASKELTTKSDLIATELRLIKWTLGTGAATILALAGILKYMIHP